jgi:hypothetical protein
MASSERESSIHHWGRKIALIAGSIVAALIIAIFIFSFFLDAMVRARTERAMNEKLKGYHITIDHAHLQLLNLSLTLRDLKIVQQEHPHPPVADFRMMRFSIEWLQLFWGHVVGDAEIWRPYVHVDETQFHAEKSSKIPVQQKGWQDALENAYPFKIDRFEIDDGYVTYIQHAGSKPLYVEHLDFVARNIRNIHYPGDVYPSNIQAAFVLFGKGQAKMDGRANFLMKPFPGLKAYYRVSDVPLARLTSISSSVNLVVKAGTFGSHGYVEYSPKVTSIHIDDGTVDRADITYFHTPATKKAEYDRAKYAAMEIKNQNNRPAVNIDISRLAINDSRVAFDDKDLQPQSKFYMEHLYVLMRNVSNHRENGVARLTAKGDFMGEAKTTLAGTMRPTEPEFDLDYSISDLSVGMFTPQIKNINLVVKGGTFAGRGHFDYSPKQTRVRVDDAAIDRVDVTYVHMAETSQKETERITASGQQLEKRNNQPGVYLDLRQFQIRNSNLAFEDQEMKPEWKLYLNNTNLTLSNFSNHEQQGMAHVDLRGDFMGSGKTTVTGVFLPAMTGPEFNMNCAIENTRLTSLNPLLAAYARSEVSSGQFTVYSQLGVKNDTMSGYVKPLFSNLEVYSSQQEQGRSLGHKLKELAIAGAARILKNRRTQQQASVVNVSGKLKKPNVSSWQAFVEVLRNAFIKAILPGFDRSAQAGEAPDASS